MATCKECIHCDICEKDETLTEFDKNQTAYCKVFKNKADVVEVVRCKDCKHYKPYAKPVEDFDGNCIVLECETDENEFCSYGERRDI